MILTSLGETDHIGSRYIPIAGFCKQGLRPWGSIKGGKFFTSCVPMSF
jgi:hypothetical protein